MKRLQAFEQFARVDHTAPSLRRRSIRSAAFMASGNTLDLIVRLGTIPILARLLTPEDFGIVAMAIAFTAIADGFRDLGLGFATIQRPNITHRLTSNLFWVNAAAGFLFALLFMVGAPAIARFYTDQRLLQVTSALALTYVFAGLCVQHQALMSRQLRQGEIAFVGLAASIASSALAILLAVRGWGYWALVWREVARVLLIAIGVWARCPWLPGRPSRDEGMRQMLKFGGELSLTHLLTAVISNADRILIGRFHGADSVGLYRQAQLLLLVPVDQLNAPIVGVAQPALSALQSERERYRNYYRRIVQIVSLLTVPLGVFVAIFAKQVTLLLLGPMWLEATELVRVFGLAAAIRPAVATSAVVLITSGRSSRYLKLAIAHSILLLGLMAVGVNWGAEGVAVANLGTTLLMLVPKLYISFRETPVSMGVFFGAVKVPALAAGAMAVVLLVCNSAGPALSLFPSLMLGGAVGGLSYGLAMLAQPDGRSLMVGLFRDALGALRKAGADG